MKVALLSLEVWDSVWRRNQHLSAELVRQGHVTQLLFVEPARRGRPEVRSRGVRPGITALTPSIPLPRSLGGLRELGARLRSTVLADIDLLWVNDPTLGVQCLRRGTPAVYDVTDDWRASSAAPRIRRRIIRAENRLARAASTIVCSQVLHDRWLQRYGVDAPVVPNGVDPTAWQDVHPVPLLGPGPHVGYVGTLHEDRLDLDLVVDLARSDGIGTVHLIGPNCLSPASRRLLHDTPGVAIHGPVAAPEVPAWMTAMDVLISPHRVSEFTLSLDAIKAYEYAVSGRPVVATPTSGFTSKMGGARVTVTEAAFVQAVKCAAHRRSSKPFSTARLDAWSWRARAAQFQRHLTAPRATLPRRGGRAQPEFGAAAGLIDT